jgi:CBS domain-containing protein
MKGGPDVKVEDLMTSNPLACGLDTTTAAAANLMWTADCGVLPVLDAGRLAGIVTDRDMYIALATRNVLASNLTVGEVASKTVYTCAPEDDVLAALATMRQHNVRRLPVVGFGGTLLGMLSMNDIVLALGAQPVYGEQVIDTLQSICTHHDLPAPPVVAA